MHANGAYAVLARNQDVATQPCEVARDILVDPRSVPKVILCYRREQGAGRGIAEGTRSRRDDIDAFRTVVTDDI